MEYLDPQRRNDQASRWNRDADPEEPQRLDGWGMPIDPRSPQLPPPQPRNPPHPALSLGNLDIPLRSTKEPGGPLWDIPTDAPKEPLWDNSPKEPTAKKTNPPKEPLWDNTPTEPLWDNNPKEPNPVDIFRRELKESAQEQLQANRERLNAEQVRHSKDHNPNSPAWKQLWQVASQHRTFSTKRDDLSNQLTEVTEAIDRLSVTPDENTGRMANSKDIQNSPKQQRLVALNQKKQQLQQQILYAKQMQRSLEYAYPALLAVRTETGEDPQDVPAVQGRLSEAFGGIRSNIDQLSGALEKDPSVATLFDTVVQTELARIPQADQGPLVAWLKQQRENKANLQQLGLLASGGLLLASLFPVVRLTATGLRLLSVGLGSAVVASQLPDLMLLDLAAQAGRGGAGQLTGQTPEETSFNLFMGYTNLVLAGLDVGLEVGLVQKLVLVPELLMASATLTREQSRVLMASLAQMKGEVSDAVMRKMIEGVRVADAKTTLIVVNEDGSLMQMKPLEGMTEKLESTATARASGKAKQPNPNVSPEILAKWSKTKNWDEVEPLIGTAVNKDTQLPPGYRIFQKPESKQLFILRETADDASFAPLMIKNGKIQVGKTRLSRGRKGMEDALKAVGIDVPKGYQLNHLVPDAIAQSDPMMIEMLKRNIYDVDRASNLLPMPGEVREAHPDLIGHYGSHERYNELVKEELKLRKTILIREHGSLSKVPDEELQEVVREIEDTMREEIMNHSPDIPTRYDPATKTRVLSEELSDPDFVA